MIFFTPYDFLLIPAIILSIWAQMKVKSTYHRYAQVGVRSGMTGAEVAQRILLDADVHDVGLEVVPGTMTDHYDPRSRTLRLSEDVYYGHSISALGIAAHEVGHAIQHARDYAFLNLRNVVYPVCSIGSGLAFPLILIGFIATLKPLITLGILFFAAATFFTLITLPVEFDASKRALRALNTGGYLHDEELTGARKVLSAAALTYVAAAVASILELVRLIAISRD